MKKLMIFGGSGFVGGNMAVAAQKKGWTVCIADSLYRPGLENVQWITVDITDAASVNDAVERAGPDAVVNVAAIADIDKAEQHQETTWKVNVTGAQKVAESCARQGIKHIFFSSDAVFDGKGSSYSEGDAPAPVNYYGLTKLEAEKAVLSTCPTAVAVRISLVVGFPATGGNSFLAGLEDKLLSGKEIFCPEDEVRTPIDVLTLCDCVLELAESTYSGVLHLGSTSSINRYTLTKKLAGLLGFDDSLVKLKPAQDNDAGRVSRHKNGIINITKAGSILKTRLLSIDETISRALETKRRNSQ